MLLKKLILSSAISFSFYSNSKIVETIILKDNKDREIVLYGDHHEIPSQNQIDTLKKSFQKLSKSAEFKKGKIKIYHEGFSLANKFNLQPSLKNPNQELLTFIDNYSKKNKNIFSDIDCRKHCIALAFLAFEINKRFVNNKKKFNKHITNFSDFLKEDINNLKTKLKQLKVNPKAKLNPKKIIRNELLEINKIQKFVKNYLTDWYTPANANQVYNKFYENVDYYKVLDINFLLDINEDKKAKKIILFAGADHTANIAKILKKLNFNIKEYINSEKPEIFRYITNR